MQIFLIRHAQPDWEPNGLAVDEPHLTAFGHEQAARAAEALGGIEFDAFYASPLLRVRETVEPIIHAVGREPEVAPWLREMGLPTMEGRTAEQVQQFFQAANARDLDAWWEGMPGGESFRHFYERVSSGIEGLLRDDHDASVHVDGAHRLWQLPDEKRRILIAAHEGTNAVLLSHLLGIEPTPWAWVRFSSNWAGISVVHSMSVAGASVWALDAFNRTEHLRDLEPPGQP